MQQGFLHLHNFLRWIVLLMALITLIRGIAGMGGNKPFGKGDKRAMLFLMISCDIQLLLGIILYFTNNWFHVMTSGGAMANSVTRYWATEHLLGMLVAITLVHAAFNATKKDVPDGSKFKKMFWFTFIGLILILVMIPWPGREVARPLFPGMH